jgi:heptosyltransferase-2
VSTTAPAAARPGRVLVRLPNWLGDTVMTLPMLEALGAAWPATELWCLGPWAEPVLEAVPGVARCLDAPRTRPARGALASELRRARLDVVILTTNSFRTALEAWRTRAPRRIGFAGEGRGAFLTDAVPFPAPSPHQVAAYLRLLAPLGLDPAMAAPVLSVSPARVAAARALLAEIGLRPRTAVGLQLGAAFGPSKLWAPDRLARLSAELEARGVATVFLGPPSAAPLLGEVAAALPSLPRSLVGRDRPALLPALLRDLAVLVAPDSGPAHVAAAVGTPVVTLFGPTDPRLTAPLGPGARAIWQPPSCAPCFLARCPIDHRCLGDIRPETVLDAVLQRLGPGRAGGPRA